MPRLTCISGHAGHHGTARPCSAWDLENDHVLQEQLLLRRILLKSFRSVGLTDTALSALTCLAFKSLTAPARDSVPRRGRATRDITYASRCTCADTLELRVLYQAYGVSYSGASYKFTILDPSGTRRATQAGQLAQTSYLSLLTPYAYVGLGRTNNYIENLFVGSTRHQPQHYFNVEGLIPNSQVLIVPYQPANVFDPSTWTRQLYLHPGDWIPGVTLSLLGAMAVLGITVLVLHLNEKVSSRRLLLAYYRD